METAEKLTGVARDLANLNMALKACRKLVDLEYVDGHCGYCNKTSHRDHPYCPVKLAQEALDY